jgi:hypothetical protein
MTSIFQDRHSGMDCRNPGATDGFELAIHGTGYPLPGEYDELAQNLTKEVLAKFSNRREFRCGREKESGYRQRKLRK